MSVLPFKKPDTQTEPLVPGPPPRALPSQAVALIQTAATVFLVEPSDITGRGKHKSKAAARQVVMWVMRKRWSPQPSLTEIAAMVGNRDHGTVTAGVRKIDKEVAANTELGRLALRVAALSENQ